MTTDSEQQQQQRAAGTSDANPLWLGPQSRRYHATLSTVRQASDKPGVAGAADFVGAQAATLDGGPAKVYSKLDRLRLLAELLFALRPFLYGT